MVLLEILGESRTSPFKLDRCTWSTKSAIAFSFFFLYIFPVKLVKFHGKYLQTNVWKSQSAITSFVSLVQLPNFNRKIFNGNISSLPQFCLRYQIQRKINDIGSRFSHTNTVSWPVCPIFKRWILL